MDSKSPVPKPPRARRDYMVLAILLGLLLFNSPFYTWWVDATPPWYVPYAFWLLLIVAIAFNQFGASRDD